MKDKTKKLVKLIDLNPGDQFTLAPLENPSPELVHMVIGYSPIRQLYTTQRLSGHSAQVHRNPHLVVYPYNKN